MENYENTVISHFHIIFTFVSYYFHIFIIFFGSGLRSGAQKSNCCYIPDHILFILFSYICENLVFRRGHTDNLYKHRDCPGSTQEAPRKHPGDIRGAGGGGGGGERNPMDWQNKHLGRHPGGTQPAPSRHATNPGPHISRHFC
jgi:hypothetical protein